MDLTVQHIHRHAAFSQNGIMEGADIECVAKGFFSLMAQVQDFQFTDLVGRRLPRPAHIAGHFILDVQRREGGVFIETGLGLLACPAIPVQARVGDEPAGTPHFHGEAPKALIRRFR